MNSISIETPALLQIIKATEARQSGEQQWEAKCPAHDDRQASLCIGRGKQHDAVLFCQAGCSTDDVLRSIGMTKADLMTKRDQVSARRKSKIVATYDYFDKESTLQFQVVRFDPKGFRQRKPKTAGEGWDWNRKDTKDVLYRLPELLAGKGPVLLLEGEKDVENARKLGFIATTNAGGAKKFRKCHTESLAGRDVVLVPDKDQAGEKHIVAAAELLKDVAKSIKVIRLPVKDLSDWVADGGTKETLQGLLDNAEDFEESPPPNDLKDSQQQNSLELTGFADFVKENPTLRQVVVDQLLRLGETCNLIAATKVGKSWLAADLAMAVATGSSWLKIFPTAQAKVVVIDNELHEETLASRFDEIAKFRQYDREKLNENLFPLCLRGGGYDIDSLGEVFESVCDDVGLIVLDAWYRFIPPGTSENDNAQMMAMYNTLDAYAKQLNCAFVVVHHASKGEQGGKSVTDVGSGAGAMSRAADTHLVLRPHEDEGLSVLSAATRSFPPLEPLTLFYTWPCWHRSQTEPKVKSRESSLRQQQKKSDQEGEQKIIEEFAGGDPFTAGDVRSRLGWNKDKATRLLKQSDRFKPVGFREPKQARYERQELFVVVAAGDGTEHGTEHGT